jgi:regulatory protein
MKKQTTARDCFAAALRVLTQRDHSCAELSEKLAARGFPQDQIQWAIDQCLRFHYLDDERFANAYIGQLQRKGYGLHRIQQKLAARGVAGEMMSACLAPFCSDTIQARDCRQAMTKKLKNIRNIGNSPEARVKLHRFLLNRGFSSAIIRRVLEEELEGTIWQDVP